MNYDDCSSLQVEGIALAPKKIVKGIPCFDESTYFFEPISRQTLLSLTALAGTVGWKRALTALEMRDPWITDPKRDFFLSILEIKENDRVLDAGAGWGVISARIARGFPSTKVYAFDKTVEELLFADQIKRQEHLDNMRIVQGDITNPPFETNFFDVVIMIGLLEWLGVSTQTTSPRAAQVLALKRTHDILRPGGRLLIGIENRIGYKYFLGVPDDHTHLRFTNLMPRRFADFYMKLRNKGSYRTYTYSLQCYKKLLREGGFKDATFYAAYPDYRFPTLICDLNSVKEIIPNRFAQMLPRSILATLTNSFYIRAKR
jgi:ubiquinone/menaquinone biosynthesis C-methylase UbiE